MLKARRSTAVTLCQRGFLAWSSSSRTYSSGLQKRVAVIGAGSSGVAAAKCAKDEGFDVVTFEKSDTIGGNWVFREEENHSSVYRTTSINTSKDMMSYADYPMPKHLGPFPDRVELCQYFNDYAEHFDVKKTIRFNTNVDQVKQLADGRWEITYKPTQSKSSADATKEVFDSVLVCNGHHWNPRLPKFPGMEKFEGKQQHSHSYKDPYPYKDKRVLVVGIGNSGVDVATEASRWTSKLFMSTRSGAYVMPKYVLGQPIDALFGSRAGFAAPLWVRRKMLDLVLNAIHGPMSQWGLQPKGFDAFGAHPTVSSDFLPRIGTGSVVVKPNVKEIKAKEVVFEDGSVEEIDTIIYATGYKITFPFFEDSLKLVDDDNNIPLYKHIFPTHVKNLAFIGLIQPLGAIFPIAEMQSRWATRVFNAKNSLPSVAAMETDVKNKLDAMKKRYNRSPRHTIQVDYIEYMDEIAEQFGAKPKVWSHGMQLAMALYFGPATPIQYRLDGPGAWAGAKDEIISKFKDHTRNLLYRTTPKAQQQQQQQQPQHSSRNNTPLATM